MRYEKKMLILSGSGKGVVVIERSGAGVKFTLNAFSLVPGVLKAGIVTPRDVIVRDLPPVTGSTLSATFATNDIELDRLHFALFDTEIVLYGATGERMWESNLCDILTRRDRMTSPTPVPTPLAAAPDGEYTRLPPPEKPAAYLDESLPRDDFYTPLDYAARMSVVDAFLDTPRAVTGSILDGLSPTVTPHAETTAAVAEQDVTDVPIETVAAECDVEEAETAETVTDDPTETVETVETDATAENAESSETSEPEPAPTEPEASDTTDPTEKESKPDGAESSAEAAASAEFELAPEEPRRLPWEMESRYLSARGTRKSVRRTQKVEPLRQNDKVKKLRDMLFFERSRQDIEKLFSTAPKDDKLKKLLPDVEWVRVELPVGAVSVGRGGDSFLCYAVGGTYAVNPFGDEAQWLPEVSSAPADRGYWLIFQSLATGEVIRTE